MVRRVHYEGDLVHHGGSLWQCIKDSGRPPPHEDWVCMARAGRAARTPRVCGTWSPDGQYRALELLVHRDQGQFRYLSRGWMAGSHAARQARPAGPRAERGEKGERGPPGQSAPLIVSWVVERTSYSVVPILFDGTEGPRLELRPLFEQFHAETGP
jgi:hypothetical protein